MQQWRGGVNRMNVFLVWTTPEHTLSLIVQRVIESVLVAMPEARVCIFSNTLPTTWSQSLQHAGFDVHVVPYEWPSLIAGLPGERWLSEAMRSDSSFLPAQLSDLLRVLLLYRYGGLYLDTDALWLRNARDLPDAFIGLAKMAGPCDWCIDGKWYAANGVMRFPAEHPLLESLLLAINGTQYDPHSRGHIGPKLLTQVLTAARQREFADLALLPQTVLYPVSETQLSDYSAVVSGASSVVLNLWQSHSLHLFSFMYSSLALQRGSAVDLVLERTRLLSYATPLCSCVHDPSVSSPQLCAPLLVVVDRAVGREPWWLPHSRLCLRLLDRGSQPLVDVSATLQITPRLGAMRTSWIRASPTLQLAASADGHRELSSLTYVHTGGYCDDVVDITLRRAGHVLQQLQIPVQSPCFDVKPLPGLPFDVPRHRNPDPWPDQDSLPAATVLHKLAKRQALAPPIITAEWDAALTPENITVVLAAQRVHLAAVVATIRAVSTHVHFRGSLQFHVLIDSSAVPQVLQAPHVTIWHTPTRHLVMPARRAYWLGAHIAGLPAAQAVIAADPTIVLDSELRLSAVQPLVGLLVCGHASRPINRYQSRSKDCGLTGRWLAGRAGAVADTLLAAAAAAVQAPEADTMAKHQHRLVNKHVSTAVNASRAHGIFRVQLHSYAAPEKSLSLPPWIDAGPMPALVWAGSEPLGASLAERTQEFIARLNELQVPLQVIGVAVRDAAGIQQVQNSQGNASVRVFEAGAVAMPVLLLPGLAWLPAGLWRTPFAQQVNYTLASSTAHPTLQGAPGWLTPENITSQALVQANPNATSIAWEQVAAADRCVRLLLPPRLITQCFSISPNSLWRAANVSTDPSDVVRL